MKIVVNEDLRQEKIQEFADAIIEQAKETAKLGKITFVFRFDGDYCNNSEIEKLVDVMTEKSIFASSFSVSGMLIYNIRN